MSKETDYGILLLTYFASVPEMLTLSARELAKGTQLPLPMVSKILKILAKEELLISHRGAKGGYGLAKLPREISLTDIITAIDGPFALTECIEHPGDCRLESSCRVRTNWEMINQAVQQALEGVTLAKMAQPLRHNLVSLESGFEQPA
ncbi:MAG: SUF system Fe-S cluster assembly regulator [Acidobacteriota bacterium]